MNLLPICTGIGDSPRIKEDSVARVSIWAPALRKAQVFAREYHSDFDVHGVPWICIIQNKRSPQPRFMVFPFS